VLTQHRPHTTYGITEADVTDAMTALSATTAIFAARVGKPSWLSRIAAEGGCTCRGAAMPNVAAAPAARASVGRPLMRARRSSGRAPGAAFRAS